MTRAAGSPPGSKRRTKKAWIGAGADAASAGVREFSAVYPTAPESVGSVRRALASFSREIGASEATIADVELAVSEAVTNVVVHAYRDAAEAGTIEIAGALASGELWVIVADTGSGLHPRRDSPGLGLGLGLIAQVSDGVDLVHRASGGLELRMRFVLARSDAR